MMNKVSNVLLTLLLLLVLRQGNAASKSPKAVNVLLRSKWEGTPLLMEAG
jgi:hypothetical protein